MKKLLCFLGFVAFLVLIWFAIHYFRVTQISPITLNNSTTPSVAEEPTPQTFTYAKVTRVIDGDTIVIDTGQHVRYIGMNTPEIETGQCYAIEASKINTDLVLGKEVKLVKDVSETDKYGRLLRFVYVGDQMIDDELVKDGAAKIDTVPPDVEFKEEFQISENYAKENNLGLWGKCN